MLKVCIDCGNLKKHQARGYCKNCYIRFIYHNGAITGKWSEKYDACIDCKTTERPHHSKGRCNNCRSNFYKWQQRNRVDFPIPSGTRDADFICRKVARDLWNVSITKKKDVCYYCQHRARNYKMLSFGYLQDQFCTACFDRATALYGAIIKTLDEPQTKELS